MHKGQALHNLKSWEILTPHSNTNPPRQADFVTSYCTVQYSLSPSTPRLSAPGPPSPAGQNRPNLFAAQSIRQLSEIQHFRRLVTARFASILYKLSSQYLAIRVSIYVRATKLAATPVQKKTELRVIPKFSTLGS
jgi:hypothetical protein